MRFLCFLKRAWVLKDYALPLIWSQGCKQLEQSRLAQARLHFSGGKKERVRKSGYLTQGELAISDKAPPRPEVSWFPGWSLFQTPSRDSRTSLRNQHWDWHEKVSKGQRTEDPLGTVKHQQVPSISTGTGSKILPGPCLLPLGFPEGDQLTSPSLSPPLLSRFPLSHHPHPSRPEFFCWATWAGVGQGRVGLPVRTK